MNQQLPATQAQWITEVLQQHEGPLLRYAQRFTLDLESARDVVQETFLKLCKQPREALDGHLVEWLYTVCRNAAIDSRRKDRRMSTLTDEARSVAPSTEPAPEQSCEHQDSARQILSLLNLLPESQQSVIRLRFQNGLSYKEISGITGLTVNHVGVLLHTGLKTLRERLQPAPAS